MSPDQRPHGAAHVHGVHERATEREQMAGCTSPEALAPLVTALSGLRDPPSMSPWLALPAALAACMACDLWKRAEYLPALDALANCGHVFVVGAQVVVAAFAVTSTSALDAGHGAKAAAAASTAAMGSGGGGGGASPGVRDGHASSGVRGAVEGASRVTQPAPTPAVCRAVMLHALRVAARFLSWVVTDVGHAPKDTPVFALTRLLDMLAADSPLVLASDMETLLPNALRHSARQNLALNRARPSDPPLPPTALPSAQRSGRS
mmetsp:Transcript_3423/g.10809  ORF Transcript_3423/g.10809 Transcript_3423/m.10809 type:complete len:263 (-) Transcript_3423:94-882(-)